MTNPISRYVIRTQPISIHKAFECGSLWYEPNPSIHYDTNPFHSLWYEPNKLIHCDTNPKGIGIRWFQRWSLWYEPIYSLWYEPNQSIHCDTNPKVAVSARHSNADHYDTNPIHSLRYEPNPFTMIRTQSFIMIRTQSIHYDTNPIGWFGMIRTQSSDW